LIALPVAIPMTTTSNTGIVLVEKGLQDCPALLEKGDIEAGNSEATPELLVFQWKKKSNKVV
jgi:hypothetical protein